MKKLKQTVGLGVMAMTLVGISTFVGAADRYGNTSESPTSAVQGTNSGQITGLVQNADASNKQLQVKDNSGQVETLNVSDATVIKRDGQTVQLADLKMGDPVIVEGATLTK